MSDADDDDDAANDKRYQHANTVHVVHLPAVSDVTLIRARCVVSSYMTCVLDDIANPDIWNYIHTAVFTVYLHASVTSVVPNTSNSSLC